MIGLEPVELRFPFAAPLGDPGLRRLEPVRLELDGADPALLLGPYQPAFLERFEVLHHCWKADRQRPRQFGHGRGSAAEPGKHSPPNRVGERLEGPVEGSRIVKHMLKYRVGTSRSRYLSRN